MNSSVNFPDDYIFLRSFLSFQIRCARMTEAASDVVATSCTACRSSSLSSLSPSLSASVLRSVFCFSVCGVCVCVCVCHVRPVGLLVCHHFPFLSASMLRSVLCFSVCVDPVRPDDLHHFHHYVLVCVCVCARACMCTLFVCTCE